jgi:hypothetical protein
LNQASAQLDSAAAQWKSDVAATIAKPTPDEAVAFLFAKDYGLMSLDVLQWRYMRIRLLRQIDQLRQTPGSKFDFVAFFDDLQKKYVVGSIFDFFPELIDIAFLSQSKETEEAIIGAATQVPDSDDHRAFFASALYRHFTTRRSIRELSNETKNALRHAPMNGALCDIVAEQRIIPNMSKPRITDLVAYCGTGTKPHARKPQANH